MFWWINSFLCGMLCEKGPAKRVYLRQVVSFAWDGTATKAEQSAIAAILSDMDAEIAALA